VGPIFVKTEDPDELQQPIRSLVTAAYCPKVDLKDRRLCDRGSFLEARPWLPRWGAGQPARCRCGEACATLVTDGLALADNRALGCVDIAGSFNATVWYGPHPDNCRNA
jgi:hypothetical protein